jgi:hypothetical protein
MATKKKNRKNQKKSKKAATKKVTSKTKLVKKKPPSKKNAAAKKKATPSKKRVRGKSERVDTVTFEPKGLGARSGGQSGDLQGLSNAQGANSESVDELLEEGNAFEAEVVKGVEDVQDEKEVRTHEVPEDDVPDEYLDKDA